MKSIIYGLLFSSYLVAGSSNGSARVRVPFKSLIQKYSKEEKAKYIFLKFDSPTAQCMCVINKYSSRVIMIEINEDIDQSSDTVIDDIVETGKSDSKQSLDGKVEFHKLPSPFLNRATIDEVLHLKKGQFVFVNGAKLTALFDRPNNKYIFLSADSYR